MFHRPYPTRVITPIGKDDPEVRLAELTGRPAVIRKIKNGPTLTAGNWSISSFASQANADYAHGVVVSGPAVYVYGNAQEYKYYAAQVKSYIARTANFTSWTGTSRPAQGGDSLYNGSIVCNLSTNKNVEKVFCITKYHEELTQVWSQKMICGTDIQNLNTITLAETFLGLVDNIPILCYWPEADILFFAINRGRDMIPRVSTAAKCTSEWQTPDMPLIKSECYSCCWSPSMMKFYLIVGGKIVTTTNGLSISTQTAISGGFDCLCASTVNPWLLSGGASGSIGGPYADSRASKYTKDGVNWQTCTGLNGYNIMSVCYIKDFDMFCASAENVGLLFSKDLEHWTKHAHPAGVSYFTSMDWSEYHKSLVGINKAMTNLYRLPITAAA